MSRLTRLGSINGSPSLSHPNKSDENDRGRLAPPSQRTPVSTLASLRPHVPCQSDPSTLSQHSPKPNLNAPNRTSSFLSNHIKWKLCLATSPATREASKKGHLSFIAGQIIDVVGIKSRHWLIGSYISKSGKVRTGNVPRGYTVVYHPEIWAIMAESKFTRDRVRLGVRAKIREDRPGAAGVDGPPNRAYDRDHDLPQKM